MNPTEWVELFRAAFSPRLHLGFGNPNTAGALVAMLMVAVAAVFRRGRWRLIFGCFLWAALAVLLAMTASRGGLIAVVSGCAALAVCRNATAPDRWILLIAVVLAGAIFGVSPSGGRMEGLVGDASVSSRWEVLSKVPAMVSAAPNGWGVGRSAEAYHHWFQTIGNQTPFRHLLSTHAIWLVERSWLIRCAYVLGWCLVIGWCLPRPDEPGWRSAAAAIWITFGVAGCFSHVGESPWMWGLPAVGTLVLAGARIGGRASRPNMPSQTSNRDGRATFRKHLNFVPLALLVGVGGLVALAIVGKTTNPGNILLQDGFVRLAADPSASRQIDVAVVPAVVGAHFGQQIRRGLPDNVVVRFAWDPTIELTSPTLFLAGPIKNPIQPMDAPDQPVELIWINAFGVMPKSVLGDHRIDHITVLWGEFAPTTAAPWRVFLENREGGRLTILRGEGGFVTNSWQKFLTASLRNQ